MNDNKRARRKFSDEFKRDAVELVRTTGRPVAEVAAELGIYDSTLGNWVLCRRRHKTHYTDLRIMPRWGRRSSLTGAEGVLGLSGSA